MKNACVIGSSKCQVWTADCSTGRVMKDTGNLSHHNSLKKYFEFRINEISIKVLNNVFV
jgi:hypothetical protein